MAKRDQKLKTLAQRMVHAREGTGLTTAQLARRMGVKTTTLTNWEAGVSEPRANRLMTLAGILNVSLTWLVTGKGEGPLVHTVDTEMDYLRASLLALKEQAETTAGQIDEIVKRLDEFRADGSRDES